MKFDINDFYLSITEKLLMKSLNYAIPTEAIDEEVAKVAIMSGLKKKTLIWM